MLHVGRFLEYTLLYKIKIFLINCVLNIGHLCLDNQCRYIKHYILHGKGVKTS